MAAKKKPAAALQYLDPSFFERNPKHRAQLEEAKAYQEIARAFFDLRAASGLSAKEVGRAAGMSARTIEKLESGEHPRPTLALLRQVASALGKKVELRLVAGKKGSRKTSARAAGSGRRKSAEGAPSASIPHVFEPRPGPQHPRSL